MFDVWGFVDLRVPKRNECGQRGKALENLPFRPTRLRQEFLRGLDAIQNFVTALPRRLCLSPGSRAQFLDIRPAHGRKRNQGLRIQHWREEQDLLVGFHLNFKIGLAPTKVQSSGRRYDAQTVVWQFDNCQGAESNAADPGVWRGTFVSWRRRV